MRRRHIGRGVLLLLLVGLSRTTMASDGGMPDAGTSQAVPLAPRSPPSHGILEFICGWLDMACGGALATVRSRPPVRDAHAPRATLAVYDLGLKAERVLIPDCGNCRTPVVLDAGTVAYANGSGVVVARFSNPESAAPVLRVPLQGVKALLGARPGSKSLLLAVVEGDATDAGTDGKKPLELRIIDLDKGTVTVPSGLGRPVVSLEALPVLRPGQLRNGVALVVENGRITQRKAPFAQGPSLLPPGLRVDGSQRMDPVWLSDSQVLYVRVR